MNIKALKEIKMNFWLHSLLDARCVLSDFISRNDLKALCYEFSDLLITTYRQNKNVFICGNGGSHCDAMHFAEELTGRFKDNRRPLGALALGDPSHITCVGNDFGFNYIFSRQLEALSRQGDALIAISTSGNSQNVVESVKVARAKGMKIVGLLGKDGGKLLKMVDIPIIIPSNTTARIQEMHIKILHIAIEVMERELFPENYGGPASND